MARLGLRNPLAHRAPRTESFSLADNEAVSLGRPGSGLEVACVQGMVWLTQEGDPVDHVLGPGEEIRLTGRGRVAMMAFAPSQGLLTATRIALRAVPQSGRWTGATCDISSR